MPVAAHPDPRSTIIVVGRFPPPRDGQSVATERLAELLEAPYQVVRFNTEPLDEEYVAAETRWRTGRVLHYLRQRFNLARALNQYPTAPVVWTSISPTLLGHVRDVVSVLPSFGRERPVIAVSHRATLGDGFEDGRTRATMVRIQRRSSVFVFLTKAISESVSTWIPDEKRAVIPNTIAEALLATTGDLDAKRAKRHADERLELLFVSNMLPEKGWMDILRAVPLVRREGHRVRIRFAGRWVRAEDEKRFAQVVAENALDECVEHLGGVTDVREIRRLYQSSDALLLPTYHPTEGMPLAILEAFAWGMPVVGTRQGGLADLIEEEGNGIVVPPRDPAAIARAINALTDRARLLRLSDGARRMFVARFDPDTVQMAWIQLIESVCPGRAGEGTQSGGAQHGLRASVR
jgi:glycosyltransferase involved in cell wall biosynthesis